MGKAKSGILRKPLSLWLVAPIMPPLLKIMKQIQCWAQGLAVSVVVLLVAGFVNQAMAQDALPMKSQVVSLKGKARYSSDRKSWQDLKKGAVLTTGCLIQTADKSVLDIAVGGSANTVRIFESTVLGIDKMTSEKTGSQPTLDIQLDLRLGQISGRITKLSEASKYEIKIPGGVAGIVDANYAISSAGEVHVVEGMVVVAVPSADGSITTKTVTAGQHLDGATGQIQALPTRERALQPQTQPKEEPDTRIVTPPPAKIVRPGV
jgi:hypothetical protein